MLVIHFNAYEVYPNPSHYLICEQKHFADYHPLTLSRSFSHSLSCKLYVCLKYAIITLDPPELVSDLNLDLNVHGHLAIIQDTLPRPTVSCSSVMAPQLRPQPISYNNNLDTEAHHTTKYPSL